MPRDKPDGDSGPSEVLFLYGLTMMMAGALVYSDAEHNLNSLSGIFVANGFAVFVFACAASVREHGKVKKGDPKYKEYMIGMHLGVFLPAAYSALCLWRIYSVWDVPEMNYIIKYMAFKALAGIVCCGLLMRFREKKKPAPADEKAQGEKDTSSAETKTKSKPTARGKNGAAKAEEAKSN